MPLHAEDQAGATPADRLDQSVGHRACLDHQIAPQVLHRLMVDRVDRRALHTRIEPRQPGAGQDLGIMELAVVLLHMQVLHLGGPLARDVLVERAAQRHIDQLAAAADAHHRLARADEGVEQVDLVAVAHPVAAPLRAQRRLAIALGRDVVAALQHQAVELAGVFGQAHLAAREHALALDGGNHHRQRPPAQDPVRHRLLQIVQRAGEDATDVGHRCGRKIDAGGNADQRRTRHGQDILCGSILANPESLARTEVWFCVRPTAREAGG